MSNDRKVIYGQDKKKGPDNIGTFFLKILLFTFSDFAREQYIRRS